MSAEPLVSVIVPTYGRPEMLRDALDSVRQQTYAHIELVIVDDASPDPVEPQLQEQLGTSTRWRCIRHANNRGANAARTTGIEHATGDILAFLDDDDRWLPKTARAHVDQHRSGGEDLGVVLVGQRYVTDTGRITGETRPAVHGAVTRALLTGARTGPFSTMSVDASIVQQAGMPDDRFPSLQDREWQIRLSRHGTFASVAEPLVLRHMGSHAQIGDDFTERRDITYPRFVEKHRELAVDLGVERAFLAWLARLVAVSGLHAGEYHDAARFAIRAWRMQPTRPKPLGYALLAIGGDVTYRPAVVLKRRLAAHQLD